MTTDSPLILPLDAVDADGNEIFASSRGVRFLAAPEAKFANLPAPTPQEIKAAFRNVSPTAQTRTFTLRTMQARMLWLGRLPPARPDDGPRIPGVPFAHFILTGLLRRRTDKLDACLDNLARHADAVVRGLNAWRRKNTVFVERTIPDGAKPLSDPASTSRFFLETQFPSLMKLATAIAHFDTGVLGGGCRHRNRQGHSRVEPEPQVIPRPLRHHPHRLVRDSGVPQARPPSPGRRTPAFRLARPRPSSCSQSSSKRRSLNAISRPLHRITPCRSLAKPPSDSIRPMSRSLMPGPQRTPIRIPD